MALNELIEKYKSDIDYGHDDRPSDYMLKLEGGFLNELIKLSNFQYGPEQMRQASEAMFDNISQRQPKYEVCLWAMRRGMIEDIADNDLKTRTWELIKKVHHATYERSYLSEKDFENKKRELSAFVEEYRSSTSDDKISYVLDTIEKKLKMIYEDARFLTNKYPVPDSLDGLNDAEQRDALINWDLSENHAMRLETFQNTFETIKELLEKV